MSAAGIMSEPCRPPKSANCEPLRTTGLGLALRPRGGGRGGGLGICAASQMMTQLYSAS